MRRRASSCGPPPTSSTRRSGCRGQQARHRAQQHVQAFVGVERTDEADQAHAGQAELLLECEVGAAAHRELVDVHRVRDHRDLGCRDAARHDILAQAFADGGDGIGALQRPGFERAGGAVAQAEFLRGAVVDRGVFPECAHFVHDRNAEAAPGAQRGNRVERGRVRVQDVRLDLRDDLGQAPGQAVDHLFLVQHRQFGQRSARGRGAVEVQAVDGFFQIVAGMLLGAGHMEGFPAERALLAQDRAGAEGVAAVQRDRVVEDVQDTHHAPSISLRRKASNISVVQIGAL
jgi:hypothetical protein